MTKGHASPATKILWGQIVIVTSVALLFVWAATQWVAFRLGFQPQLGEPMTEILGLPVAATTLLTALWATGALTGFLYAGHRLAQGLFAADCAAELRLEQATRRLAGTEARHADLFRNALERSVDSDVEGFFVDFNRELHPVVVEGLHSALHRVEA